MKHEKTETEEMISKRLESGFYGSLEDHLDLMKNPMENNDSEKLRRLGIQGNSMCFMVPDVNSLLTYFGESNQYARVLSRDENPGEFKMNPDCFEYEARGADGSAIGIVADGIFEFFDYHRPLVDLGFSASITIGTGSLETASIIEDITKNFVTKNNIPACLKLGGNYAYHNLRPRDLVVYDGKSGSNQ